MSQGKKQVRSNFRSAVFKRDGYRCVCCKFQSSPVKAEEELDAHHITDRNQMPNGGYVKENGISLCATCHELAEVFHRTGTAAPGYEPETLYQKIGSSYDKAVEASKLLG